ncbi:MAG: GAP family protein [Patescibacteria group bacterium]|nr:GAP family protein [Patescibacteria group bacterium]
MLIPKEFIEIIPFALAAAISPLIFTVALLVASQKNNSFLKSMLFLLGAFVSISAIGSAIFIFLSKVSPARQPTREDAIIDLLIGVLLIGFAIFQVLSKKTKNKASNNLSGYKALGMGVIFMALNTSTIIMFLPAAHVASYYSDGVKIELLAVMIFFALLPVLIPPAMLVLIKSKTRIDSIKNIVNTKGQYIVAAVFGLLGIFELIKAFRVLI